MLNGTALRTTEHRALSKCTGAIFGLVALILLVACESTDDERQVFGPEPVPGEREVLGLEPVPGASDGDRIGDRPVLLFDDAEAFRDHVDDQTVAIIVPGERINDLGEAWIADQYQQHVMIVILNLPVYDLAHLLGVPTPEPIDPQTSRIHTAEEAAHVEHLRRHGWDQPYVHSVYKPCDDAQPSPFGSSSVYAFSALTLTLEGLLDRLEAEC